MLHLGTADPVTRRRTLTRPQVEFGGRVRTGELHGQKEKSDAGRLEYNSTKVRARSVDEQSSGVWVARRSRGRGAGVVCLAESPVPHCATPSADIRSSYHRQNMHLDLAKHESKTTNTKTFPQKYTVYTQIQMRGKNPLHHHQCRRNCFADDKI